MLHPSNGDIPRAHLVAAAVYTKFGGHCNGAAKEEQSIDRVQSQRDGAMTHEALVESDCYQVDEGEHAEDRDEHVVVDDGWIAGISIVDDVADEGHDEKSPKELRDCQRLFSRPYGCLKSLTSRPRRPRLRTLETMVKDCGGMREVLDAGGGCLQERCRVFPKLSRGIWMQL